MFGSKNIFIGLDVGSFSVKAVAIQPNKDRMTLVGYAQQRIGDQDAAIVIRQVVDQLGVKPNQLVTSVSGRSVIVRQVETPRLTDNELRSHITHESDKYIPFGIDEVMIDFQPLPDAEGEKGNANIQVQLVAVRRGFIEDHIGVLNSADLYPKAIDVDIFALANAYEVFGPAQSADEAPVVALVDIGASKVCAVILKGNKPLFTREFYLAGNEITDAIARQFAEKPDDIEELKINPGDGLPELIDAAMPAIEDLANEIRLSFDYVESQFDEQVHSVVLSGGSSQLATISDILGNILGRSITVFDGLSGLDLDPKRYDIQDLEANAPSLTVALGLAVHLAGDSITGLGGHILSGWNSGHGGSVNIPQAATPETGTSPARGTAIIDAGVPEETQATHIAPTPSIAPPPPLSMPAEPMAAPAAPVIAPPPTIQEPHAPLEFPAAVPAPENIPAPVAPVLDIPIAEPSGAHVLPPDAASDNLDQMFGTDADEGPQASDYGHQSSMLVILDDDGTGSISSADIAPPPPPVFDLDADNDDGLPPLPKS